MLLKNIVFWTLDGQRTPPTTLSLHMFNLRKAFVISMSSVPFYIESRNCPD